MTNDPGVKPAQHAATAPGVRRSLHGSAQARCGAWGLGTSALLRVAAGCLLLSLVLAAALAVARPAHAQGGATSPVTVVPAGGKPRGIQLRSQTVDVVIGQNGGQVWADTQVWLRLTNPAPQAVAIALALPGPAIEAFDRLVSPTLPSNLQVTLDDEPLPTDAVPATAKTGPGQTATIEIAGNGQVSVRLTYRQALPVSDKLAYFAYPLAAADQWAGVPESLRVSVKFGQPVMAEQLLGQAPADGVFDGQTITWQKAGADAGDDIWLAFMAPDWWSQFSAARAAAAAPDARPAQHIALSQFYEHLAALPRLVFRPDVSFYARYYPAAVGALQTAAEVARTGGGAAADAITAHASLARLYRQQAGRLGDSGGDTYLQLAASEAENARALGAGDADLIALAADAYRQLATRAAANGDAAKAAGYLDKLARLEPTQGNASAEEQRRATQLQVAAGQLAHGDLEGARRLVLDTLGPDAAELPGAGRPLAGQAVLVIHTQPNRRDVRLTLGDYRDTVAITALLERAADSLRAVQGLQASSGTDWLSLTLPYDSWPALTDLQQRAASALLNTPELALLNAMLRSDQTSLRDEETSHQISSRYVEKVDLSAARQAWESLAEQLDGAAEAAAAKTGAAGAEGTLAQIQNALWKADAAAWRELAENSRAEYSAAFDRSGLARGWVVEAGAARTLSAESAAWRDELILGVAAGAAAALALIAFAVWRWL